jgi:hypothetical protein
MAARFAGPWLGGEGIFLRAVALAVVICLGVAVYGAAALALRATTLSELKASFRKG